MQNYMIVAIDGVMAAKQTSCAKTIQLIVKETNCKVSKRNWDVIIRDSIKRKA